MPTRRLTVLDVWILCWLDGEARRSQGLLAASAQKLFEGLARQDQQQIRQLEQQRLPHSSELAVLGSQS